MMEQVNLSRLSHGVRAAAMMRRCLNEAMVCARKRVAFGKTILEYPLLQRQLLKIAAPVEQSLSMFLFAANARPNAGANAAADCLRTLTPLLKSRACRDNVPVATGAMEVRGGNGYIEEWVNARLIRDAHIGVLWEGTSHINALDIVTRAGGKSPGSPAAGTRATEPSQKANARQAASGLYHVTSAILMMWEAARPDSDARRALYARLVLEHRLSAQDPLEPHAGDWERGAAEIIFSERHVAIADVAGLLIEK